MGVYTNEIPLTEERWRGYRRLEGKSIQWMIDNMERLDKIGVSELQPHDVILYLNRRDNRGHSKEALKSIYSVEERDNISFFSNFTYEGNHYSKIRYSIVNNAIKIFPRSFITYEWVPTGDNDYLWKAVKEGADYKVQNETARTLQWHSSGISPDQLRNHYVIRGDSKIDFINWMDEQPVEVKT